MIFSNPMKRQSRTKGLSVMAIKLVLRKVEHCVFNLQLVLQRKRQCSTFDLFFRYSFTNLKVFSPDTVFIFTA